MPAQLSGATILAIGISQGPAEDFGNRDDSAAEKAAIKNSIEAAIKSGVQRAVDAGATIVPVLIDTQNAETLEAAKAKLRSGKWDAVSLGFGVRINERFTPWFEEMVHVIMSEGRAPRIMFPVHPSDLLPSAERVFALG